MQTTLSISICNILIEEGFIQSFELNYLIDKTLFLSINLKFKGLKRKPSISYIKRISRPGFRVYLNSFNIPIIESGIGLAVLDFG